MSKCKIVWDVSFSVTSGVDRLPKLHTCVNGYGLMRAYLSNGIARYRIFHIDLGDRSKSE